MSRAILLSSLIFIGLLAVSESITAVSDVNVVVVATALSEVCGSFVAAAAGAAAAGADCFFRNANWDT